MYLLKKVFQLRDKSNPDMEKPFLEHLEDLRVMITRVVLTLIISMVICFTFQDYLMSVLRQPVDDVWMSYTEQTLPDKYDYLTPESWEEAKDILDRAHSLTDEEKVNYYSYFSDEQRRLMHAIRLMRAAKVLSEEKQEDFLNRHSEEDSELHALITDLRDSDADPDVSLQNNLRVLSTLKPTESFMLSMKLAFFAGVAVSFPFLLFFILQFVLPGLHSHERKILWPSMAVGFGLFGMGVLFAYFIVLPRALSFFFNWSLDMGVSNDWRIGEYIGFATQFILLFGLSFELPVVIMALVKIGLLSYEMMKRTRAYAVLAIVVLAAMITPTSDVFTLMLMAGPMYILYEICIWLAWFDNRKEEREEKERMERLLDDPDDEPSDEDEEEDIGDPIDEDDDEPRKNDD